MRIERLKQQPARNSMLISPEWAVKVIAAHSAFSCSTIAAKSFSETGIPPALALFP
jgi:hypothetical protein